MSRCKTCKRNYCLLICEQCSNYVMTEDELTYCICAHNKDDKDDDCEYYEQEDDDNEQYE